ncbi:CoA-transferase family III domain-containing protein [Geopyxis carbonaria]|nr:CoA-transferase family III domain-containing protein [Geopyxis carbonaria]
MVSPPPLSGLRVIEFAGLAPGPFAGKLLAEYGALVLRVDRHNIPVYQPTNDLLAEHKRSIRVNLKDVAGQGLILKLAQTADVIIDPFRPGVLEKLGLGPEVLCKENPRLIYARLAGFRRDGKYKNMAGHDINYISVSGALSLFGRADGKPYPPGNVVADFAGGGAMCFIGILLALLHRERSSKGQIVEANMVDGSAYMTTWPRFLINNGSIEWHGPRGTNLLDGGAPFYDTYETSDGKFMAVGALEPTFYSKFIQLLLPGEHIPDRSDPSNWDRLRVLFSERFLEKSRREWEIIFDGQDACVTPVKTLEDLHHERFDRRAAVKLEESPAKSSSSVWQGAALKPGEGGKDALENWWGFTEGDIWVHGINGHEMVTGIKPRL